MTLALHYLVAGFAQADAAKRGSAIAGLREKPRGCEFTTADNGISSWWEATHPFLTSNDQEAHPRDLVAERGVGYRLKIE